MDYMNIRTIDGEFNTDFWKRLDCGVWIKSLDNGKWIGDDGQLYDVVIIECSDSFIEVAYLIETTADEVDTMIETAEREKQDILYRIATSNHEQLIFNTDFENVDFKLKHLKQLKNGGDNNGH